MTLSTRPDISSAPVSRGSSSVRALLSGVALAAAMAVQQPTQAMPVVALSVNSLATAPGTISFPYAEIVSLNVGQGGTSSVIFLGADGTSIIFYIVFQPLSVSDTPQAWGAGSGNDGTYTYTASLDALSVSRGVDDDRPHILTQSGYFSGQDVWAKPNNIGFDGTSIDLIRTINTPTNAVPEPSSAALTGLGLAGVVLAVAGRRRREDKGGKEEPKTV